MDAEGMDAVTRLVVNSRDLSERLREFSLACKCGSRRVTLDVDWAAYPSASWLKITLICDDCHADEEIYDAD